MPTDQIPWGATRMRRGSLIIHPIQIVRICEYVSTVLFATKDILHEMTGGLTTRFGAWNVI